MQRSRSTFQCIALAGVLLTTACALWFVPESRSRGHIFDEALRGRPQFDAEDGRRLVDRLIHETFPLGTPVVDVIGHIEGAGGVCMRPTRSVVKPSQGSTICTYGSTNYFARAYMGMGEPTFLLARNEWTVFIRHSDGITKGYFVENQANFEFLSREDYLEGLDRQRTEEEQQRIITEN